MLDAQARVLYVGKARNLKARVSNYARPTGHSSRIARMISETSQMMFLTTKTETEALLLEQNLIKQLKPRYNVLLRDDKSFPNILVTTDHEFPQIKKHRGAKKEKGAYYGPFASAGAVNKSLNQLQRVFQLRNCSDAMFETRTRPCLQYQIKRCSGPCVGRISARDYRASVKMHSDFCREINRNSREPCIANGASQEAMEFERAAALRDRIRAMTQVKRTKVSIRARSAKRMLSRCISKGRPAFRYFSFVQIRIGETAIFIRASVPIIPMQRCLRPLSGSFTPAKKHRAS